MSTQLLDRKRSYGTVYGDPQIGYEQDGRMFRHDGTAHVFIPVKKPDVPAVPTAESFPTASQIADTPVLKAIETLSSQIKEMKSEPKGPDPARSEAARKIWADRRAREAEVAHADSPTQTAQP